jgi:hypothetical protein
VTRADRRAVHALRLGEREFDGVLGRIGRLLRRALLGGLALHRRAQRLSLDAQLVEHARRVGARVGHQAEQQARGPEGTAGPALGLRLGGLQGLAGLVGESLEREHRGSSWWGGGGPARVRPRELGASGGVGLAGPAHPAAHQPLEVLVARHRP